MSWLARREREVFTGWMAGLGTDRGHRLVVGHWPSSPYGVVTEVLAQEPPATAPCTPHPQLAAFLGAAYHFDAVEVVPCSARRARRCWTVQAGPLQLSFTSGAAPCWAGSFGRCPRRWPNLVGGTAGSPRALVAAR